MGLGGILFDRRSASSVSFFFFFLSLQQCSCQQNYNMCPSLVGWSHGTRRVVTARKNLSTNRASRVSECNIRRSCYVALLIGYDLYLIMLPNTYAPPPIRPLTREPRTRQN